MDLESITTALFTSRRSLKDLVVPADSGLYAYFLRAPMAIASLSLDSGAPIYVGHASNLYERVFANHLNSESTGWSTLRRSLGAILKQDLELTALPRSRGPSDTNADNYRFAPDGETRLTQWMLENLEIGVCAVEEPEVVEKEIIVKLKPVLNLQGWNNPARRSIRAFRERCRDEARMARQRAVG